MENKLKSSRKIGDIIKLITKGTTPPKGKGFVEKGINYIKSDAVTYDRNLDRSKFVQIDEETHKIFKRSQLEENDILYSMAGIYLGKNAIVPKDVLPANTNQALAIIRLNQEVAYPNYVSLYLSQDSVIDYVNNMSGQSAQPNINFEEIKSIEIQLPSLPEQKAIASVLSSLDDKIDLLHQQNQTLEALAETLYLNFIGERDFNSKLSDIFSLQNGYAFKSQSFKESGTIRVIKIKNISGDIVDITNSDFIDDESIKKLDTKFKIYSGDILIAMTGAEVGKLGIVPETDQSLWLNQRVGLLKEKFEGAKYLAYLHLKSDFGQDYIENTATGSAQPNISGEGIENCEFPLYEETELREICNKLSPLYDKVIFNLGQIQTLTQLRDTLLPKLMSGEVRVSEL